MSKTDSKVERELLHPASTSKVCTKCGAEKPLDQFSPLKLGRLGRASRCKACTCAAAKDYAARNPDKVAARKKAYRATPEGKAAARANWLQYKLEHAEELRAKRVAAYHATKDERKAEKAVLDKEYRERNREAISARRSARLKEDDSLRARNIERAARWHEAHKDVISEKGKEFYKLNRDAIKRRVADYQKANPDLTRMHHRVKAHRRRERLRDAGGTFTKKDVDRLLVLQRGKCANCRSSLDGGFHIDHRHPVAKGGSNDPGNIELLCGPCNMAKSDKLPHEFAQEQGRLL